MLAVDFVICKIVIQASSYQEQKRVKKLIEKVLFAVMLSG